MGTWLAYFIIKRMSFEKRYKTHENIVYSSFELHPLMHVYLIYCMMSVEQQETSGLSYILKEIIVITSTKLC